ncbi:MAG: Gfo/Idh/MocA family oxidoreductase [Candidatus Anstonellales archaeon]
MDVGVVGVGMMGKNHLRIYSEMRGIDDIYVYDTNVKAMKENAKIYSAEESRSLEELLKEVDLVSICVPTGYHFETAKKAIEHGVNFLVEKPITKTIEEARRIVSLAEKQNLISGVGHIERFNPVISEIKKIVDAPLYVEIKRHNPSSARIRDSDVIIDLMIHDIDIVWNKLFENADISAAEGIKDGEIEMAQVIARDKRTLINISASRLSSSKIRTILIEEKEKTIFGDLVLQEVYVYKKPNVYSAMNIQYKQENVTEKLVINKVEPLRTELNTFVNCVRNNKKFEVPLEEGLNALKVAYEIKGMISNER